MQGRTRQNHYDVVVVGGGPAGATASTVMAMDGRSVLLLEREVFPRYHVGESLLPSTIHGICELLGVRECVTEAGFMPKRGGTFRWGANPDHWTLMFSDQFTVEGANFAYQVERSRFDEILLRNAAEHGVDVREGHRVLSVETLERGSHCVEYLDQGGKREQVSAKYIVDASGSGLLANQVGRREYDALYRNIAVFGYFEGGGRLAPPFEGNVLTVAVDEGWLWYIPLRDDLTSVGAVLPMENGSILRSGTPKEVLRNLIDGCAEVAEILGDAPPVNEGPYARTRILRDSAYQNERYWRDGVFLVGDAACFIDPLFSSGVHLATFSGLLAARTINSIEAGVVPSDAACLEFERRFRREFGAFYQFLLAFYQIHDNPKSAFWSARKIERVTAATVAELVSGLQHAEERFRSSSAFLESTRDESHVLGQAAMHASEWSRKNPELAARAKAHIEVLFRERRDLLESNRRGEPVLDGGLVVSDCLLRWATAQPIAAE